MCRLITTIGLAVLSALLCSASADAQSLGKTPNDELRVLFLGDDGPHRPRERFAQLEPVMRARGVALTYTDDVSDLNADKLAQYDALLLYANIDRIEPTAEKALLDYVENGGGFVPLHCASYCFRNSDACVALIGAQFERHGWGPVRETVVVADHPTMREYDGFESLDETYVHHKHNEKDRTVLSYRIDGDAARTVDVGPQARQRPRVLHGVGPRPAHLESPRISQSGRARHSLGRRQRSGTVAAPYRSQAPFVVPPMTKLPAGPPPFEYVDVGAKIPNYVPSEKWGEQGEPLRTMQKPLAPQESMNRMVVPEGFHVELFAAEPELDGKPLCMTWDERGRLWIGETVDYPNELQPQNKGRDRIRICEDTDGDGRADKFTVFAENLSIPTSIAFARGGVIVHNGTETLFLKDTNGDDRADERRVLLSNGRSATRTAAPATCNTASTTGSGACRVTTSRRSASATRQLVSLRVFTAFGRMAPPSSSFARRTTTRGASA